MEKKIQKKRKYIKEIDGLRALAVIMVLAISSEDAICEERVIGSNRILCNIRLLDHRNSDK